MIQTVKPIWRRWSAATVLTVTGWSLVGIGWLWVVLALSLFPAWPAWGRAAGALLWLGIGTMVWRKPLLRRKARTLILVGVVLVRLLWTINQPSNERDWVPDQARVPTARFEGSAVTIRNVRHATYRTTSDFDVSWHDRKYDLGTVTTVDFVVEPFSRWPGLAHTFLTFGFEDGRHVAISVETRREKGETFGLLKGMFRHFEIIYVVGDERDLIGLRANIRKNPVYVYPGRVTREQARALLTDMLKQANRLAEHPVFYHSITNTCTTRVMDHVNRLRTDKMRFGWRTLLPAYSNALAWDLELIDFDGSLDEARQRFLINARSVFGSDEDDWSAQIRAIE